VAFSADGARLAAATPDGVRLWDFRSNEALAIEEEGFLPAAVLFDPIEPWILYAAGRYDPSGFAGIHGAVMIFDLQGESVNSIKLSGLPLRTLACSSQGELLAAAGDDNAVYVVEPRKWSQRLTLVGHYGPVNSLSFSRDSTLLVSGSDDKFVRVWYVGDLLVSEDSDSWTQSGSDSGSDTHFSGETDSETDSQTYDPGDTQSLADTETTTDTTSDTETQASTDTETST
jgi:WD40 repeat protein